jgi:hypothetical protein
MHSHRESNMDDKTFLASVGIRDCSGDCRAPQSGKVPEFHQLHLCCPFARHHTLHFSVRDRIGVTGAVDCLAAKPGIETFNGIEVNWTEAFQGTPDVKRGDW